SERSRGISIMLEKARDVFRSSHKAAAQQATTLDMKGVSILCSIASSALVAAHSWPRLLFSWRAVIRKLVPSFWVKSSCLNAPRNEKRKCSAMNWRETGRSEEHTSELQSRGHLVCRLLLEKKKCTELLSNRSTAATLGTLSICVLICSSCWGIPPLNTIKSAPY